MQARLPDPVPIPEPPEPQNLAVQISREMGVIRRLLDSLGLPHRKIREEPGLIADLPDTQFTIAQTVQIYWADGWWHCSNQILERLVLRQLTVFRAGEVNDGKS